MIYLGEQEDAKNNYSKIVICWLKIKIKGKKTIKNSDGHKCSDDNCLVCNSVIKKKTIKADKTDLKDDFVSFVSLLKQNIKLIDDLVTSKPEKLIEIEKQIKDIFINDYNGTDEKFANVCETLFINTGYTNWFVGLGYNYKLSSWLNRNTCTYCNRQYTFTYKKQNKKKGIVPQFDHWFSKVNHPILALSFYNLIPSCPVCNFLKSDDNFELDTHYHPYVDSNLSSSFVFSYEKTDLRKNLITIFNKENLPQKTKNTVNDLNIELLYKGHSAIELQDLIDLRTKYSDNYLDILLEKTFDINMPEKERYRLIFGIEIDEDAYHKRIFSKFKKDIIEELLRTKKNSDLV